MLGGFFVFSYQFFMQNLLTREDIMAVCKPVKEREHVAGVYVLIAKGGPEPLEQSGWITYVGQSENVYQRIAQHIAEDTKDFEYFHFIPCDDKEKRLDMEAEYIFKLQPSFNHRLSERGRVKNARNHGSIDDGPREIKDCLWIGGEVFYWEEPIGDLV